MPPWNRRNARTEVTIRTPGYESGEEWDPEVNWEESTCMAEIIFQGTSENETDRETRTLSWLMRVGPEVWIPTDCWIWWTDRESHLHMTRVLGEQPAQPEVRRGGLTHREITLEEVLG